MPLPRLHKSTFFVGIIASVVAVLLEVPGRVASGVIWSRSGAVWEFDHGWPWVYLHRHTLEAQPSPQSNGKSGLDSLVTIGGGTSHVVDLRYETPYWGVPWLNGSNWRLWQARSLGEPTWNFNRGALIGDFAVVTILIGSMTAAWEFRRRRRFGLISFRMIDLLAVTALLCAAFGWGALQYHAYREEERLAGPIRLEWFAGDSDCVAPIWARSLVGCRLLPSCFWRRTYLYINFDEVRDLERELKLVAKLKYVRTIEVDGNSDKRFPFSELRRFKRMKTLLISTYPNLDEDDLNEITKLTSLERLVYGYHSDIRPDILSWLKAELPNCKVSEGYDE